MNLVERKKEIECLENKYLAVKKVYDEARKRFYGERTAETEKEYLRLDYQASEIKHVLDNKKSTYSFLAYVPNIKTSLRRNEILCLIESCKGESVEKLIEKLEKNELPEPVTE